MSPRSKPKGDVVAQLEERQRSLRASARRAFGVTGTDEPAPRLRDAIGDSSAGWYPLAALSVLVVVDQFQAFGVSVLAPEISRSLGVGRSVLALLLVLQALAVSVAALPFAALVQRRARRAAVSIVTAFAWSVLTLLTAFVTNVWGLLGVIVGNGVATGSVQAVHRPLLFDNYRPNARVRVLSTYRGASVVGSIAAPLLVVAVTAAAGFTWRAVFVVMGAVSLGAAAVSLRLRDPGFGQLDAAQVRAAVRAADAEAADVSDLGDDNEPDLGFFEGVRRLLVLPTVRRLLAAWATLGVIVFPLVTFAFFFLDERWNVGPGGRALFFAAAWTCSIPALAWFGTRGEDAFSRDPSRLVQLTAGLLVVAGAGIAVAVVSPVFVVMLAAFAVVFAAAATLPPALSILLLSIVPPRLRAHASALAGIFLTGVGGIGGLLLLSGIDRRFGISTALFLLAIPCLVAALVVRSARDTIDDDLDHMIDEIVEREEIGLLRARGGHVPMLTCRRLDFSYGQVQVLFDVDFTVDDGEMVALLGVNGAGKSTLLKVISGIGLPSRGSVRFRGTDITYLDAERRLRLGITQIPGGRAVFGPMSVVDNLRVFGFSYGRDRASVEQGIDAAFDAFPRLAERRDALASTLSGGEQQMLGLGKAFILRPRVLLIDELSLGLAPKIVAELLEMVRRINAAGAAIVLVEQSVNIALSIVDHAYFMEKGEIRFDGRAADLLGRRDLLRSVFLEGAAR